MFLQREFLFLSARDQRLLLIILQYLNNSILKSKEKGLENINCESQNSHGDMKYRMGNKANNVVKTMHGVRWTLDLSRGGLYKVYRWLRTVLYT